MNTAPSTKSADTLRRAVLKAREGRCEVRTHESEPRTYMVTTPEGHEYKTWFRDNEFGTRDGYCNCQTDHSKYACYVLVIGSIADSYETSYPPVDSLLFAEYVVRVKSQDFSGFDFHASDEWTRVRLMVNAPQIAWKRYGKKAERMVA